MIIGFVNESDEPVIEVKLDLGKEKRAVHVICSPREEYLGIITAYVPILDKWENDFRTRRRPR